MEFSLTDLEMKAARALVQSCLDGMGGEHPLDLEDDEYTWVEPSDLVTSLNISKHQAAGLFSSLSEKKFLFDMGEPFDAFGDPQAHWVVATEGWRWIAKYW